MDSELKCCCFDLSRLLAQRVRCMNIPVNMFDLCFGGEATSRQLATEKRGKYTLALCVEYTPAENIS